MLGRRKRGRKGRERRGGGGVGRKNVCEGKEGVRYGLVRGAGKG